MTEKIGNVEITTSIADDPAITFVAQHNYDFITHSFIQVFGWEGIDYITHKEPIVCIWYIKGQRPNID